MGLDEKAPPMNKPPREWNEIFEYRSGKLYWRTKYRNKEQGDLAGNIMTNGRYTISYKGKRYVASRVIWEMFNGPIPKGLLVDHINRDGTNDRIENLRLATLAQNSMNSKKIFSKKPTAKGRSKYKGVVICQGKYIQATIRHQNKRTHLGMFKTEIDAAKAYDAAAENLYKEYALLNRDLYPEDFQSLKGEES